MKPALANVAYGPHAQQVLEIGVGGIKVGARVGAMPASQTNALIELYYRTFNSGDREALLALLTDNVPLYQGESNHNYSIHTHIWNNVDPDRCGIYPNVMDSNFGFESYAAHILQQPLVVARHGARIVGVGRKSAFEVYPSFLGHGDIEQILSMFYYDVCLNHNGIELRTADSLAPRYAASYAQLIKTLFSSHAAQEGILRRYAGANSAQIEAAKVGICCNGYQAQVYGRAAAGEVSWLLAQAKSHAAAPDDRRLLEPLAELAAKKRTPREISGCV